MHAHHTNIISRMKEVLCSYAAVFSDAERAQPALVLFSCIQGITHTVRARSHIQCIWKVITALHTFVVDNMKSVFEIFAIFLKIKN